MFATKPSPFKQDVMQCKPNKNKFESENATMVEKTIGTHVQFKAFTGNLPTPRMNQ